jgi:hypothetical protein
MNTQWTLTKLIVAGSFGALILIVALLASGLVAVTGLPLTGGIIGALVEPMLQLLLAHIINLFGAVTIASFVLSILALPTPYIGPPGFLPKLVIIVVGGFLIDLMYLVLKRWDRRGASVIIGGVMRIYFLFAIVGIGRIFNIPGIDQAAQVFTSPLLIIGAVIEGVVGGYLGWAIYFRIKETSIVLRIKQDKI